jgi:hypothetical protein
MPLAEFEPEIPAMKWLRTYSSGRTATGTGPVYNCRRPTLSRPLYPV